MSYRIHGIECDTVKEILDLCNTLAESKVQMEGQIQIGLKIKNLDVPKSTSTSTSWTSKPTKKKIKSKVGRPKGSKNKTTKKTKYVRNGKYKTRKTKTKNN